AARDDAPRLVETVLQAPPLVLRPPRTLVGGTRRHARAEHGQRGALGVGRVALDDGQERLRGLLVHGALRSLDCGVLGVVLGHSGMFPCFLAGTLTTLRSSRRRPSMIWPRVSDGGMTAAMRPRSAAMYGLTRVSSYSASYSFCTARTSLPSSAACFSSLR